MLFDIPIQKEEKPSSSGGSIDHDVDHYFPNDSKLEDVLNLVRANVCIHWHSKGDWSTHDLLGGLLDYSGPADVMISTYAFSEYPARLIAELKRTGQIKKLKCIIDSRIDTRSAGALNLVRNCADKLVMTDTHAKVTIIENRSTSLVIVGSANYTTNKRHEAGMIIANPRVVAFHKKWIEDAFNEHN